MYYGNFEHKNSFQSFHNYLTLVLSTVNRGIVMIID